MTGRLRCTSFHSVKGGVGKSTLSSLAAVWLARNNPSIPVYLLDMDLTGTSLADVLPLEAPAWGTLAADAPIDLLAPPTGYHSRQVSRARIEERQEQLRARVESGEPIDRKVAFGAPFLNDFLLFATPDWDEERDLPVEAISWRMQGGPPNLHILPSSALPEDLQHTLPVIFDEEHAAFLESRLEHLIAALVPETGEAALVIDTPPTIPGLSRSVLSLAFRLSREPKTPLSEDEYMPVRLQEAELSWSAFLVATPDLQDLRAAARWLELVDEEKRAVLKPLLNRVRPDDPTQRRAMLERVLHDIGNALLQDAVEVEEGRELQFFQGEQTPPHLESLMSFLGVKR